MRVVRFFLTFKENFMAYASIYFVNPHTGAMKEAPVGFSWTTFFFGIFPALIRGDWKWGLIMLILALITMGFSNLVFMFIYNKMYIKDLIDAGFKAKSISNADMDFVAGKLGLNIPRLDAMS